MKAENKYQYIAKASQDFKLRCLKLKETVNELFGLPDSALSQLGTSLGHDYRVAPLIKGGMDPIVEPFGGGTSDAYMHGLDLGQHVESIEKVRSE